MAAGQVKMSKEKTYVICIRRVTGHDSEALLHGNGKPDDDDEPSKPSTSGSQRPPKRVAKQRPASTPGQGSEQGGSGRRIRSTNRISRATTYLGEAAVKGVDYVYAILTNMITALGSLMRVDLTNFGQALARIIRDSWQVVGSMLTVVYDLVVEVLVGMMNVLDEMRGLWFLFCLLVAAAYVSRDSWIPLMNNLGFNDIWYLGRQKPNCFHMILTYIKHPMKFVYKLCIFCPD